MAIMFGIGFIVYKLIIARALRGPVLSQRLITFALSMVLVNLALLLFSGDFKTIPEVAISGSIDLGFMVLSKQKIVPLSSLSVWRVLCSCSSTRHVPERPSAQHP